MRKVSETVRYIDEIGRLHIPKEVRQELRIEPTDGFTFWIDGKDIVIRSLKDETEQRRNSKT